MEPAKELKTLYIGRRPVKHYIILANTFFKSEERIRVAGRGRWITKVVAVLEILKRDGASVSDLEIGSVKMVNRLGRERFVSLLSAVVSRPVVSRPASGSQ